MKNSIPQGLIGIVSSAIILAGCGGGGGGGSSDQPSPTQPDTFLNALTPTGNATGVELGSTVSAGFSKNLLASSINNQSLTVTFDGTPLAANVEIDNTGKRIQAQNITNMGLLCRYTATLDGGISDQDGNTLGNNYSWQFTTRDGQWQEATSLDQTNNALQVFLNHLELLDNGDAFALWSGSVDVLQGNIFVRQFINGQWQPTVQINTPGTNLSGGEAAVNDRGDAVIAWRIANGANDTTLFARVYNAQTNQWTAAQQLPESNNSVDSRFSVTISENGTAYVAWSQQPTANDYDLYVSKYQSNTGWQTPEVSLESNDNDDFAPHIAITENDDVFLIWRNIDAANPTEGDIHAQHFLSDGNGGGAWTAPLEFEVDASNNVSHSLTVNKQGYALVTWNQVDEIQFRDSLYARYFNPTVQGGRWGEVQRIEDQPGLTARTFITLDNDGNALVTWQQESNDDQAEETFVYGNYYNATQNDWLTNPVRLASIAQQRNRNIQSSRLARSNNGSAILTWSTEVDGNHVLYSRYFDNETKQWQATQTLNTTSYKLDSAVTVLDDQNHALTAWTQRVNDQDSLHVSRFNSYTQEWGNSTQISQAVTYVRDTMMSVDEKGRGLILWEQRQGQALPNNSEIISSFFN